MLGLHAEEKSKVSKSNKGTWGVDSGEVAMLDRASKERPTAGVALGKYLNT